MEQDFFDNLISGQIYHAYLINSTDSDFIDKVLENVKINPNEICIIEDCKIEAIRQAKYQLFKKPLLGERKGLVIKNAADLSAPAQNSLLKILEEPPSYAVIMLFTDKEDQILPTIKSRCRFINIKKSQNFDFRSVEKLEKDNLVEKFKFAQEQAENGNLDDLLDLWLVYFHRRLLKGEKVDKQINKIKEAKSRLGANINKRLLLETVLVDF